ncbi:MAG: 3-deoxy-D-manno-octulosonic acid transferase [Defluviimonas sp.]|uniref:3-deoxy-D-manno-octulosonic acid transferase n=1 Tax=Albidovulum sp. TaxID=1872424 RepID=UPI001D44ACA5|nr:3-deoxy-D-manno-octulosonic acid transferase [Paracoccaceae bacterium]MCC0063543.1 3-deoxy-D-manno-octulosonic acid transferase [Defluviimonas sp.]
MTRSLTLALYLAAAGRGQAAPDPGRPARPPGGLLWLCGGRGVAPGSLAHLARLVLQRRPKTVLLISCDDAAGSDGDDFPAGVLRDRTPGEKRAMIDDFLGHWSPDLTVFVGATVRPALVTRLRDRGAAMILADIHVDAAETRALLWRSGVVAAVLPAFRHILARDPETAARLERIAPGAARVSVSGRIEETADPLPCNETERSSMAELLDTRPVWLAMTCPPSEEAAVLGAHTAATRHAHRLLLILVPADPATAPALADRLTREGWSVALRSREEEPDPHVQIFIADSEGELGLWYRLAPLCFLGGTLLRGGGRNPFEPAALGSAIVHGPAVAPYPDAYATLRAARATREVADAAELPTAISALLAPDRAATLAHNAWAASSGRAEVAERVVETIVAALAEGGQ